jgi:hypothetical protein
MSAVRPLPVRPVWAHTRSSWLPVPALSCEKWTWLFANLLPEQGKQGCVFALSRVAERRWAIGHMSLYDALASPVA